MMAFPALMTHDGEDNSPTGAEVRVQVISVVNPGAEPVTGVPTGPEVGVRVSVPRAPTVTVKVWVADSAAFD